MIDIIKDFLYPPKCIFCNKNLDCETVCNDCILSIKHNKINENIYENVDEFISLYKYSGIIRNAIHNIKFKNKKRCIKYFAQEMSKFIPTDIDFITYVPMSIFKLYKRGYNQSEILAKNISKITKINCYKTLKKLHIKTQSTLSAKQRKTNVLNAFSVINPIINGKTILLIDDVITTGSTISEISKILKKSGALKVIVISIAKS